MQHCGLEDLAVIPQKNCKITPYLVLVQNCGCYNHGEEIGEDRKTAHQ